MHVAVMVENYKRERELLHDDDELDDDDDDDDVMAGSRLLIEMRVTSD